MNSNTLVFKGARLAAPAAIVGIFCTVVCAPMLTNKGWDNCVHLLGPVLGTLGFMAIAFFALVGLISIRATGIFVLAGMALAFRHGVKLGVWGLVAVAASAYKLFWWVHCGGLPV